MALTTVASIKGRIGLPDAVVDQDATLDLIRQGIEERILELCGFREQTVQAIDYRQNMQLGRPFYTKYRPIVPLTADPQKPVLLEARSMASSVWNAIIGDVIDPDKGYVMPLASELTPVFPPIGEGSASWYRWRQMIWPVARCTYNIDLLGSGTNPIPKALAFAAVEYVVSIYARAGGGAIKSMNIERISETYIDQPVPPHVLMMFNKYIREKVVIAF